MSFHNRIIPLPITRLRRPAKVVLSLTVLIFVVLRFSPPLDDTQDEWDSWRFSDSWSDPGSVSERPWSSKDDDMLVIEVAKPKMDHQVLTLHAPPSPLEALPPPVHRDHPKHHFRPDGLVDVSLEEGAKHPIHELIKQAEREWEEKHTRASKTLEEAVGEYKRRYGRQPPKGFDLWWKYVAEHNVQLPDEYDQIHHDLEAFWGLEPADLIKIHEENEHARDSYTIGKASPGDPVSLLTWAFNDEKQFESLTLGAHRSIELFSQIPNEHLPPFRMTFTPDDRPNRHTDFGVRQALVQAARAKTYLAAASLPKARSLGWVSACPPNSPARTKPIPLDNPPVRLTLTGVNNDNNNHAAADDDDYGDDDYVLPPRIRKTFIHNHLDSMNPCYHPHILTTHGQFVSHGLGPAPQRALVPEFAQCSTTLHHNIRFPTPYGWVEDIYPRDHDPQWEDKVDERLLWRGSSTGIYHSKTSRWRQSHRELLVEFANELKGGVWVMVAANNTIGSAGGEEEETVKLVDLQRARLNPAMMDIAFAGKPHSCAPDTCGLLEELYTWRGKQSVREAGNYKYVLDVDGNGWSGRFKRLMTSNSLIFKATIYPEWYMDRIVPWLHYVPVQTDLSDLYDALVFFRGDANGQGAHDELGKKIALAGREWSKKYWRREDMIAYIFRLTLEYARLMSEDRENMSFGGGGKI